MSNEVYLTVDRDELTGGIQVSINDDNGGFRIAGPKYCGMSKTLKKVILGPVEATEIRAYLKRIKLRSTP